MKTIAVIAELNPFHNGHFGLFEEARRLSGADHLIILMSGDFVQRGEPAVYDKYIRAQMALLCGAGLVLELPAASACGSARRFAEGSAAILDRLGVVDELWFGSECGVITPFTELSSLLSEEPSVYRKTLQQAQAQGMTFAAAQEAALASVLSAGGPCRADPDMLLSLLQKPNNRLGLEYCLALRRLGSPIRPCTLPRTGAGHDASGLSVKGISSASAIRRVLCGTDPSGTVFDTIRSQLPEVLHPLYRELVLEERPVLADDFSDMLLYCLRKETPESLQGYLDIPEPLANRIMQLLPEYRSFSSFAEEVKTKDRTLTQVRRALLHILLGIRGDAAGQILHPSCIRLLGRSERAAALFTGIESHGQISFLSRGADLQTPEYAVDLFASQLYESVRSRKSGTPFRPESGRRVITG